jgi:hypothetical protein
MWIGDRKRGHTRSYRAGIREEREAMSYPHFETDCPMQQFWDAHANWSRATFGNDAERGPVGPLKHLQKEAAEAIESPKDVLEFADCLLLTLDATRRAGFTLDELVAASWKKLEINKARTYAKGNPNEAVEHER